MEIIQINIDFLERAIHPNYYNFTEKELTRICLLVFRSEIYDEVIACIQIACIFGLPSGWVERLQDIAAVDYEQHMYMVLLEIRQFIKNKFGNEYDDEETYSLETEMSKLVIDAMLNQQLEFQERNNEQIFEQLLSIIPSE